jgi:hypothetical protein
MSTVDTPLWTVHTRLSTQEFRDDHAGRRANRVEGVGLTVCNSSLNRELSPRWPTGEVDHNDPCSAP